MCIALRMAGEPPHEAHLQPIPLLGRGFRPFFLGAAMFSILSMSLWLFILSGVPADFLARPLGIPWHRHAMVFSFTGAVIVGFLLTAVPNWTEGRPLRGAGLGLLACLWLVSVLLPFIPHSLPLPLVGLLSSLWLFLAALHVALDIFPAPGQRKNLFAPLLLSIFSVLCFLDAAQINVGFDPVQAALDVILMMMVVVGGRVIPFFTGRALSGVKVERNIRLDWILNGCLLLGILSFHGKYLGLAQVVLVVSACLIINRAISWSFFKSLKVPMLAVLHIGHLLIAVHLILKAIWTGGYGLSASAVTHSLTAGSLSFLVYGMMSRVALGHTGRNIVADSLIALCFYLLIPVFLVRVFVPLQWPELTIWSWHVSGGLWAVLWMIWIYKYLFILVSPRPDGRPA